MIASKLTKIKKSQLRKHSNFRWNQSGQCIFDLYFQKRQESFRTLHPGGINFETNKEKSLTKFNSLNASVGITDDVFPIAG